VPDLNRRQLIRAAAAAAFLPPGPRIFGRAAAQPVSRVRPGDPAWPSAALWDRLKRDVGGRLIEIRSPFGVLPQVRSAAPAFSKALYTAGRAALPFYVLCERGKERT